MPPPSLSLPQRCALALLASTLLLVGCPATPPVEERRAVCGDGAVGPGEACDDGNTLTESACTYGQASCTRCDATCATVLQLAGGRCGDGRRDAAEACDDGNTTTETACAYGQASCSGCNATCTAALTLVGGACGDGVRSGPEACDDGNTTTETACAYGTLTCQACTAECTVVTLSGAFCGDGVRNGSEACDDGNASDADACTTRCTVSPGQVAVCGNDVLDTGEACDDGNTAGGDGCPASCGVATSASDCVASTDARGACPVTLQTLKASVVGSPASTPFQGKKVAVQGALVVGKDVSGAGYWLYQAPAAGAPVGHSGIYVSGSAAARVAGERVDVTQAHVALASGQLQLGSQAGGAQLTVESRSVGSPLPAPVRVTPAEVRTGGPRAAELNGMRVELSADVVVTSANPDAPSAFDEFVVDTSATDPAVAGVRVDDQGFDYANPIAGVRFGVVRGVLASTFGNAKVLPQQADDLQRLGGGMPVRGQAATLDVGSWNVEWFGDTTNGPSDEALQRENVRAVLAGTGLDLWGVAEIVDTGAFHATVAEVPGYAALLASDAAVAGGSTWYSASEQKVGVVYRTAEVQVQSASVILTASANDFAGRPPLEVRLRVAPGGAPAQDLVLIVVHMKAFADSTSWSRRAAASTALKSYLDATFPTQKVLVVGDFNDDVDTSITTGKASPYANFVQDPADYTFVTGVLSASGQATTTGYSDAIDHHLGTNDVAATLVSGSVEVLRLDAVIPSYASTTSDHYPVISRYTP